MAFKYNISSSCYCFLFWLYYPLQSILQIVIDSFITSVIAFSVVNRLGVAKIFRTAIIEFPEQYLIAARTLAISRSRVLRKIQVPLILRSILPPIINLQIMILPDKYTTTIPLFATSVYGTTDKCNDMVT